MIAICKTHTVDAVKKHALAMYRVALSAAAPQDAERDHIAARKAVEAGYDRDLRGQVIVCVRDIDSISAEWVCMLLW